MQDIRVLTSLFNIPCSTFDIQKNGFTWLKCYDIEITSLLVLLKQSPQSAA